MSNNNSELESNSDRIKFGLIGTGARCGGLSRTLVKDPEQRGDVIALCDINQTALKKAEGMVKSYLKHGTKNYTDYRELLDNPDVDAVIISPPDFLHHKMAIDAFNAGKHVFLEKPVGINLDQMIDIVNAAKNSGKTLEVGYVLRYAPFFVEMKKMIDDEEIGEPLFCQALEEYYGAYHFYRGWWKKKANTGGIMIQKICHDMDLHYWMFGKPKKICAFESLMNFKPGGWDNKGAVTCHECENRCPYFTPETGGRTNSDECVFNDPHDITDNCQIIIQFETGLNLSMGMNFFNSRGQSDRHWRVVGSKGEITGRLSTGMIRYDPRFDSTMGFEKTKVYLCNKPGTGGHAGGDAVQILEFLQAIKEGRESKAGIESAYWSSIMIMGAQMSADKDKIVRIQDLTDKYPYPG
ncbi:MAG: hypothetical protein GF364_05375 [Candidatus Lokiarchaeota archaeon]|nr:hypothetical protein [Candidatus Lokiarchaeota archaeon]